MFGLTGTCCSLCVWGCRGKTKTIPEHLRSELFGIGASWQVGSRGTHKGKGGEQKGTGAGAPTVLPVPSSVLAKGEEDAHAGRIARSAVTVLFPLTGESHQHLGIQELLH